MVQVLLANEQDAVTLDLDGLTDQISRAAQHAGYEGCLSVALVDDQAIQLLHARYMDLDEPTDVLAFPLDDPHRPPDAPRGEVVISAETALHNAEERSLSAHGEILLYAIHGILHLQGHDDQDPDARRSMRAEEQRILSLLGEAGCT